MAICKSCGGKMDWGFDSRTGRHVPLEPIDSDEGMDRTFVDENGELRADHRDRHPGGKTVNVQRLSKKVTAEAAEEAKAEMKRTEAARKRRERRQAVAG